MKKLNEIEEELKKEMQMKWLKEVQTELRRKVEENEMDKQKKLEEQKLSK